MERWVNSRRVWIEKGYEIDEGVRINSWTGIINSPGICPHPPITAIHVNERFIMKKIMYISGVIIIIAVIILVFKNSKNDKLIPKLELVSDQRGGIEDFYIEDDKVYIICGITIINNTEDELSYSLTANSEADFRSGLITSAILKGFDENLSTNIFSIGGHEVQTIKIIFMGDYAGYPKKNDRLMPEITIVEEQKL